MMKKKLIKLLSLVLLIGTLTACGGSTDIKDNEVVEINKDKYAIEDSLIEYKQSSNGWFSRISEEDFNKIVDDAISKAKSEYPNANEVKKSGNYSDDDNGRYGYIVSINIYEDKEVCRAYGVELPIKITEGYDSEYLKWFYNVANGEILSVNKANDIIKSKFEELATDSGLTDIVGCSVSNRDYLAIPIHSNEFEKCSLKYIVKIFEAEDYRLKPTITVEKLSISRENAQKALEKITKEVEDVVISASVINRSSPSVSKYESFMDISDEEWELFQTANEK